MVNLNSLEKTLSNLIGDLRPATEIAVDYSSFYSINFDHTEKDNAKWVKLITGYLNNATAFEIHCWNEEAEWIDLALRYGEEKDTDWKYGKIITGQVTTQFIDMLLGLPKPSDTALYSKMTPFFNIFLDDTFQSCHYGTENFYK